MAKHQDEVWFTAQSCDLEAFRQLVNQQLDAATVPLADRVISNVPVYGRATIDAAQGSKASRQALMAEWVNVLLHGSGILVLEQAFADTRLIDAASQVFDDLITEEKTAGKAAADHFAKAGANDRIWNALQKLALKAPDVFASYYANGAIAMVAEAWLGPGYQITSQVNVVNPGGAAQAVHRDYHMGFQAADVIADYPAHVHKLSPLLTLQGAVAHVDMPVATGPTLYLPFSQKFDSGYFAWNIPAFKDYFANNHVQLPLKKGDAVFFNPALFHAAGHNRTADVRRMANLLQVSSLYGRAMEAVDRTAMCRSLYPVLARLRAEGRSTAQDIANIIAATAEAYAFPTNLDRDPPLGGLAPKSQAQILQQALSEGWETKRLSAALDDLAWRHIA